MRKSDAAPGAAPRTSLAVSQAIRHGDEPTRLVCLALLLAVATLALRIMAIW
jgi:hypothetical protein